MMIKFLKKASLKTKLILIYFLTIIIPLLVVNEIVLTVSGNKIILQTTEITSNASRQTGMNIKELLNRYIGIVNRICFDETLKGYLDPSKVYASELDSMRAYKQYLSPVSNYDFSIRQGNATLKIYFLNETMLQDLETYVFADEQIRNSIIFKSAQVAKELPAWGIDNGSIYVSRAINNSINGKLMAVVSIEIKESQFYSLIKESSKENNTVIICDSEGLVVSSNNRSLIGSSIKGKSYFHKKQDSNLSILDYKDNGNYKVIIKTIAEDKNLPEWQLITLIPLDDILREERKIKELGAVVCILSLAISFVIFILFLNRITGRINVLVKKMKGIKEGHFSNIKNDDAADEIGIMTTSYNMMIESLQKLIYENYEVNLKMKDITIRKQEAELYALHSQINPHFLFNTLESIRMKLHRKSKDEEADMLLNLSKMLRKSLNWHSEIILLSEEIDFVRSYLEIQRCRFKDKLSYEIDIPENLLNCEIPKLIVQPIVENSIKHGLERKRRKGLLTIEAYKTDNSITIKISDNGCGMDKEALEGIRNDLKDVGTMKNKIGIKNVNDRLVLHFGDEYRLRIESEEDAGTTVYIVLPALEDSP